MRRREEEEEEEVTWPSSKGIGLGVERFGVRIPARAVPFPPFSFDLRVWAQCCVLLADKEQSVCATGPVPVQDL